MLRIRMLKVLFFLILYSETELLNAFNRSFFIWPQHLDDYFIVEKMRYHTLWLMVVAAPKRAEGFKVYVYPVNLKGEREKHAIPLFESKEVSLLKAISMIDEYINLAKQDWLYHHPTLTKNQLSSKEGKPNRLVLLPLPKRKWLRKS